MAQFISDQPPDLQIPQHQGVPPEGTLGSRSKRFLDFHWIWSRGFIKEPTKKRLEGNHLLLVAFRGYAHFLRMADGKYSFVGHFFYTESKW